MCFKRFFDMRNLVTFCAAVIFLVGCTAVETSRKVQTATTEISRVQPVKPAVKVAIGQFENKSPYQRGIFSDGVDRLGAQAQTVLIAHLNQSNRFSVLDRANLDAAKREAGFKSSQLNTIGADYLVTGSVTDFGRKVVGDRQLFGILGRGKEQVAYSKVTLNIINVKTSEVVYSAQGAGEYALSNRELIGFGTAASYDSTLNGKVLDLAIREAVEKAGLAVDRGILR